MVRQEGQTINPPRSSMRGASRLATKGELGPGWKSKRSDPVRFRVKMKKVSARTCQKARMAFSPAFRPANKPPFQAMYGVDVAG
jgi:hypothetical protein